MSEAAIRAEIKTLLEAVSNIGVVHDYIRRKRSLAAWLEAHRSSGVVNAWTITRVAALQERKTMPYLSRLHNFKIYGLYELDDASGSEKDLQALVDGILDGFKDTIQFSGEALNSEPLQCDSIDVDELGDTAYHVVEMSIEIEEYISYSV